MLEGEVNERGASVYEEALVERAYLGGKAVCIMCIPNSLPVAAFTRMSAMAQRGARCLKGGTLEASCLVYNNSICYCHSDAYKKQTKVLIDTLLASRQMYIENRGGLQ